MGGLLLLWLLAVGGTVAWSAEKSPQRYQFTQTEMAVPIRIVLYAPNNAAASEAAAAAFARIHELNGILSDYDPQSELRRLCDASFEGNAVHVSDDLWRVLVAAQRFSARSQGAFDVTAGPLIRAWRAARHTKELPTPEKIQQTLESVGYRAMRLDPDRQTVELLKPKMRLDLGGIAKGYAVDEALAVLRKHGITRMMVEAGGNIGLGDPPPDRPGWRIGIAPPDAQSPPREYLELSRVAVSTSGDMWQYALIQGTRYSHLVDPRTGQALTDHSSVTVVAPNGMTADGLSSAVAVLGPEKGLQLVAETPHAAAFIVRMVAGKQETFASPNWRDLPRVKP